MEIVSKGNFELGAVWVARRIPDGHVSGHANQMRITTFPLDDPNDTLYAPDVISFARSIGAFEGNDEDFSFSDVYDAATMIKFTHKSITQPLEVKQSVFECTSLIQCDSLRTLNKKHCAFKSSKFVAEVNTFTSNSGTTR